MIEQGGGLVVNVASHAAGAGKSERSRAILPYSVCKAGLHRLSSDMAVELRDVGVAVVEIWPPASKTEGVLAEPEVWGDISEWRPTLFTGRVVAALAAAEDRLGRSGQALVVEELAEELGVAAPSA
jgi:NAD(P)-dependent dehydrogenase (short-subunit alcohol dehydrogenase family)